MSKNYKYDDYQIYPVTLTECQKCHLTSKEYFPRDKMYRVVLISCKMNFKSIFYISYEDYTALDIKKYLMDENLI